MPRPCAVEAHARGYKRTFRRFADATALRRGGSRSQLQQNVQEICGCHGLAPWRLTLAATKERSERFADATALRRGGPRSQLQKNVQEICGCHGLAPWRLTLAATKKRSGDLRMPRPCAVEAHARSYKRTFRRFADATALRRGGSRLLLSAGVDSQK